jgi:uroporphyrin-3 C-methyltransferase
VRVRRHDQPIEPLLTIEEEWYLYQNLRLKLEQARLAVMQRNNKLMQQTLGEADAWLVRYFDTDAAAVGSLRESIATLKKTDVQPPLPDITQSRRLLHEYQAQLAARAADARAAVGGETDVP